MNEHEYEPVKGLPEDLPQGEHIVWQGNPEWQQLALQVFHVRKVAVYFALLSILHGALQWSEGATLAMTVSGSTWLIALGICAIAILTLLAWLYSRTTIYTLTNRRLVLRFGVAVPMMINIPWSKIDSAGLLRRKTGHGDIVFTLAADHKMSYWLLWPHAKPWRFSPVQPALRGLNGASEIAEKLQRVIAAQSDSVVATIRPEFGTREADQQRPVTSSSNAAYS